MVVVNSPYYYEKTLRVVSQRVKGNTISGQWYHIPKIKSWRWYIKRIECYSGEFWCGRWFQDPPFLWQDIKFWPSGDVNAELPNNDPKLKYDITSYGTILSEDDIASVENRISSWLKLKMVIGHCTGFAL